MEPLTILIIFCVVGWMAFGSYAFYAVNYTAHAESITLGNTLELSRWKSVRSIFFVLCLVFGVIIFLILIFSGGYERYLELKKLRS